MQSTFGYSQHLNSQDSPDHNRTSHFRMSTAEPAEIFLPLSKEPLPDRPYARLMKERVPIKPVGEKERESEFRLPREPMIDAVEMGMEGDDIAGTIYVK